MSLKGRRAERGNFSDGNSAHNDEEDDEPPQTSRPVRILDEGINNKHDVTPGRCLEARISTSQREGVNMLKVDGMSR